MVPRVVAKEILSLRLGIQKRRTSLRRQIRESNLISNEQEENLMNSKAEWGAQNCVPRVVVDDPRNKKLPEAPHDDPTSASRRHPLRIEIDQEQNRKRRRTLAPPISVPMGSMKAFLLPPDPNAQLSQGKSLRREKDEPRTAPETGEESLIRSSKN